ncbi:YfhD family protein [Paenibacillus sp. GCM10023252]|uniref:YfhD family protein n=1 Tax=Paenibacillus sp. GCM10023252 TaxID=3252649 RepID=UPI0036089FDD
MDKQHNNGKNDLEKQNFAELPIAKNEDVEFSEELADRDDQTANERAKAADARAERS